MGTDFICPLCPDRFENIEALAAHLATYHLAQTRGRHICGCREEFTVKELAKHLPLIQPHLFKQHFKKYGGR